MKKLLLLCLAAATFGISAGEGQRVYDPETGRWKRVYGSGEPKVITLPPVKVEHEEKTVVVPKGYKVVNPDGTPYKETREAGKRVFQ